MCASPASRSAAGLAVVVRCDELAVVDGNRYIQGIECARAAGLLNRVVSSGSTTHTGAET